MLHLKHKDVYYAYVWSSENINTGHIFGRFQHEASYHLWSRYRWEIKVVEIDSVKTQTRNLEAY